MLTTRPCLSENKFRNKSYQRFLDACNHSYVGINDIIRLGHRLMKKEKLNAHFFGNNSLFDTAKSLALFALQLPEENNLEHMKITQDQAEQIFCVFEKRISKRIPVEYITNEANYLGNKFFVNENVLVPRSVMNTRFQDFLNEIKWENYRVLDLCTGSGCIGITLALLNPDIKVDLVDISPDALAVASENIKKHALENRVRCVQSDLFENVRDKYDLIITNPPYVSTHEYNHCATEFKKEPKLALEAGWDGLDLIHKILAQGKNYLNSNGKIIAEVGVSAARRLKRRYLKNSLQWVKYRKPDGKVALLAMDCVFVVEAKNLPCVLVQGVEKQRSWIFRMFDRILDQF